MNLVQDCLKDVRDEMQISGISDAKMEKLIESEHMFDQDIEEFKTKIYHLENQIKMINNKLVSTPL